MNRWMAALVVVVLAGCAAPATTARPSQIPATGSPPAATASPSGPPTAALEDRAAATVPITGADFPIAAFDSVWVVAQDQPEPAIVRVDPVSNQIAATIPVEGRACQGLVAAFDSVWACTDAGIARIDPATNRVISVLDLPAVGSARLAATDDSVWAFTGPRVDLPADALLRIDPRTEQAETIPLGHPAGQMTYAFESLWVTSPGDGLLLRVDPATGEVATAADGLEMPHVVTAGLDSLWVTLYGDREALPPADAATIVRLDPATLEVQGEIAAGPMSTTGELMVGDEGLWVRNSTIFLARYDPETYEPLEIIESSQGGGGLLLAYDSVWATSYDFHNLWRFDPEPGS